MLLAEDLLLLLTDDGTGKLAASSTEVDVALGGALLVELTLMQRVDVAGSDERVREGRLVVRWHVSGSEHGFGSTSASSRSVSSVPRMTGSSASSRGIGGPRRTRPMSRRFGRDSSRHFARALPQRREPVR